MRVDAAVRRLGIAVVVLTLAGCSHNAGPWTTANQLLHLEYFSAVVLCAPISAGEVQVERSGVVRYRSSVGRTRRAQLSIGELKALEKLLASPKWIYAFTTYAPRCADCSVFAVDTLQGRKWIDLMGMPEDMLPLFEYLDTTLSKHFGTHYRWALISAISEEAEWLRRAGLR